LDAAAPTAPAPSPQAQEKTFGKFLLLSKLGHGGMGIVYRARQTDLGRTVALKVLLHEEAADDTAVERFQREARAAARLRHPNIVPLYEFGQTDGRHWLTLDLIEGDDLDSWCSREKPGARRSVEILRDVAQAISYAHEQGVIHRDLKPANILVERQSGRVLVTDFGLAKDLNLDRTKLTMTDQIMGTPAYMAPEQASGKSTMRSDVYALGAVLYHLLTGGPPHRGATPFDVLLSVKNSDPALPRKVNPRVHRDAETICLKALEKDPAKRYPTAAAFAEDCERFLAGEPIAARPVGALRRALRRAVKHRRILWAVAATALVLLGATALGRFAAGKKSRVEIEEWRKQARIAYDAKRWRDAEKDYRRIVERDRNDAEARARSLECEDRLRRIAVLQLRIQGAAVPAARAQLWTDLIELDPNNAGARAQRGLSYLQMTKDTLILALKDFEDALRLDPGDQTAHYGLAVYHFKVTKDRERAEYHLRMATRRPVEDWTYVVPMATIYRQSGNPEKALELLDRYGYEFKNFFVAMEKGKTLATLRRWNDALLAYTWAEQIDPNAIDPYVNRGHVLCTLRRFDAALRDAERAQRIEPNSSAVWQVFGRAYAGLKKNKEALAAYDEVLKLAPLDRIARVRRAKILIDFARREEARRELDAVLQEKGDSADALEVRGWLHLLENRLADAERDLRQAVSLDPQNATAWDNLGAALRLQNRLADALECFERSCSADPEYPNGAYNRAVTLADLKRFPEAEDAYKKAVKLDEDGTAFFGYGYLLHELGRYPEAEPNLSCAAHKNFVRAWFTRGNTKFEQLDLAGAVEDYERTLEFDWDPKRRGAAEKNLAGVRPLLLQAPDPWKGCAPGSWARYRMESVRGEQTYRKEITYVLESPLRQRCEVRSSVAKWEDPAIKLTSSPVQFERVGEEPLQGPKGILRCVHVRNATRQEAWFSEEIPYGVVRAVYRLNDGVCTLQLIDFERK